MIQLIKRIFLIKKSFGQNNKIVLLSFNNITILYIFIVLRKN